jgi:hypothetical protein
MATLRQDLAALTLTPTAKANASEAGANLPALIANAQQHIVDLKALIGQIVSFHPAGGSDASNYAAL